MLKYSNFQKQKDATVLAKLITDCGSPNNAFWALVKWNEQVCAVCSCFNSSSQVSFNSRSQVSILFLTSSFNSDIIR